MSTKIRLKRFGKKRAPFYRIVIMDSRKARDGQAIEEIGLYHPTCQPSLIEINSERVQYWLKVGAQPSDAVRKLLDLTGDWGQFKGDKDAKSTVIPQSAPLSAEEKIQQVADLAEKLKQAKVLERAEAQVAAEEKAKKEAEQAVADAPVEDSGSEEVKPEAVVESDESTIEAEVKADTTPAEEVVADVLKEQTETEGE